MSKEYEKIREEIAKKYKARIYELEAENKKLKETSDSLSKYVENMETELSEKRDHIARLLEYMDMSPEDLELAKKRAEVMGKLFDVDKVIGGISKQFLI